MPDEARFYREAQPMQAHDIAGAPERRASQKVPRGSELSTVVPSHLILALQRVVGNKGVQRLLAAQGDDQRQPAEHLAPSIQRLKYTLGVTKIGAEETPPTYTAVTRGLSRLSEDKQRNLSQAISSARQKMSGARSWAANDHKRTMQLGVMLYPEPLYTHFHLDRAGHAEDKQGAAASAEQEDKAKPLLVRKIRQVLVATEEGLAKSQEIVDVNPKDAAEEAKGDDKGPKTSLGGYVRGVRNVNLRKRTTALGRIHLNFSKLAEPENNLAETLVHEATHKYAGTDDVPGKAYRWEPGFKDLTLEEAQVNADTYVALAFDPDLNA